MISIPQKALAILRTPWPLLGLWLIGGIMTVIIPVTVWKKERQAYYKYYGRYIEYENQQRAYEEAQNGDDNYNNNNQQIWTCNWYQFKCRKNLYKYRWNNEGGDGNQIRLPDWYASLGGKYGDDERRQREEMGLDADAASGALKFVYTAMLISFVAILAYGCYVVLKRHKITPLMVAMALFGFFSFLQMLLLPQGVIASGGRDMEDSVYGWYGQLGVLMLYTDWAFFWFSVIFCSIFGLISFFEYRSLRNTERARPNQSASISPKELDDEPESSYNEPRVSYNSMA
ncbi:hypothetical protein ACA910_014463 [Epithemia clementina (nom. ined.)]